MFITLSHFGGIQLVSKIKQIGTDVVCRILYDYLRSVEELTAILRKFDPSDPVKYDFALFGLGVFEKWRNSELAKKRKANSEF